MKKLIDWIIKENRLDENSVKVKSLSNLPLNIISDITIYIDFILTAVLPGIENLEEVYLKNIENDVYRSYLASNEKIEHQKHSFINLFYVGLFHKLENFENEIVNYTNQETKSNFKSITDLNFDFKSNLFDYRNKFRLIANSIKHNNSFPKPGLKKYLPEIDFNAKLKLTTRELLFDIHNLKIYLSGVFSFMYINSAIEHLKNSLEENNQEPEEINGYIFKLEKIMRELKSQDLNNEYRN